MGKKLERALAHVGRAFEDKGLGRERADRVGVAVTGKVARLKAPPVITPAPVEVPPAA